MKTGYLGTFVISWAQTEIDGAPGAPIDCLSTGACWRWSGEAVRVDGPANLLVLTGAEGEAEVRSRAARMVRRLLGAAIEGGGRKALSACPSFPTCPTKASPSPMASRLSW